MTDAWYDKGGELPSGLVVEQNTTGAPIQVWTIDQLERTAAWLKAHYATGTLQCPSDREA